MMRRCRPLRLGDRTLINPSGAQVSDLLAGTPTGPGVGPDRSPARGPGPIRSVLSWLPTAGLLVGSEVFAASIWARSVRVWACWRWRRGGGPAVCVGDLNFDLPARRWSGPSDLDVANPDSARLLQGESFAISVCCSGNYLFPVSARTKLRRSYFDRLVHPTPAWSAVRRRLRRGRQGPASPQSPCATNTGGSWRLPTNLPRSSS